MLFRSFKFNWSGIGRELNLNRFWWRVGKGVVAREFKVNAVE